MVTAMNEALTHRGPDDLGQMTTDTCSIAMRRLSIIDLAGGHQPMANEHGSVEVVFNGEIYNFPELQEHLRRSGRHTVRTASDTETIVHLYEDLGEAVPAQLEGMFAFCILDRRHDSLFLARDRFGEKPLFYAQVGGVFAFSSELKSLLCWPAIARRLDREALAYYLHTGFVPAPLTLFQGVQQLPPGHWLRWRGGELSLGRYYQPEYVADPALADLSAAREAVRTGLFQAVRRQMRSDVATRAFLSGGVDSSAVVAAMQHQSPAPVRTFTVRFEYEPYDESPIARRVAAHLGTEHHEFTITNAGFTPDDLWRVVEHVGQPFWDSSAIPTY